MSDMDGYLDPDARCVRHGLERPCIDCAAEMHADGWRELPPEESSDALTRAAFAALGRLTTSDMKRGA